MIKSPLRYPGGKSRAVEYLLRFVPYEVMEFREPMFGGGSLSFQLRQTRSITKYAASDINYDLYCFWKAVKEDHQNLIHEIQTIKQQFAYDEGKNLYRTILERRETELSDFQRAVDFFILNRITFSGVVDSGGYSDGAYIGRFTDSSIERLKYAHLIVKEIDFYHKDYNYLLHAEGENVFIFLDPPYYSATKSKLYGKRGSLHTEFDHMGFLESVRECPHQWLITYDNCEYIRNAYQEFYQVEWELQYGMNNYKQDKAAMGKELLIANFDIAKVDEKEMQMQFDFAS